MATALSPLQDKIEDKERWKRIPDFDEYKVGSHGHIKSEKTGRLLRVSQNQYGVVQVGMMRDGVQHHRGVARLVAKAFIRNPYPAFDTPINKDGNRVNNHVANLVWRPRWFAVKYNWQFRWPYAFPITSPIVDLKTGDVSPNSFECAKRYGLLEEDLVVSIENRTYVWPTYQEFGVQ